VEWRHTGVLTKSVARPGRKQATATEDYIYITRLASNEIFAPSNKIH